MRFIRHCSTSCFVAVSFDAPVMQGVTNDNFGPLIAYLVPGLVVLLGVSPFSPMVQGWFAAAPDAQPSIGGFLYLTISSVAVGMTVSAVRWALIDTLHRCTGLSMPPLDFSYLGRNVNAFRLLIEIHYRHYQFYANMFVATGITYGCYRVRLASWAYGWPDVVFVAVQAVFLLTSRDTLKKYYQRSYQLLSAADDAGSRMPWAETDARPLKATSENATLSPVASQNQPVSDPASDTRSAAE